MRPLKHIKHMSPKARYFRGLTLPTGKRHSDVTLVQIEEQTCRYSLDFATSDMYSTLGQIREISQALGPPTFYLPSLHPKVWARIRSKVKPQILSRDVAIAASPQGNVLVVETDKQLLGDPHFFTSYSASSLKIVLNKP